ncbi:MAG: hypothetical protein ACM3JH_04495 [Acidithiobacillales bacterium]
MAARAVRRKKASGTGPTPTGRRRYALHLAAASLFAVLVAWHRYSVVMLEKGGRFEDPDAMFHAHRVIRTIQEGRLLPPVLDPFENFPDGGRAVWPPLHDATLALLARLGGSTPADPRHGLPLAAALPVLELVLALTAAAALARRAAGPRGGVAAAWLFALTPCLARRGAFGEIDHNLTEVLGALLLLLLADSIARREEERPSGLRDPRLSPLPWAAAVLLALGFFTGLVLSAGIVAAALAARDLASPHAPALPRISLGFGLAALLLPLFASLRVTPDPADPWRLGPPYVLLLAIAAAGTGLFSLAQALARRTFSKDRHLTATAGLAAGLIAIFTTNPRAWNALVQGFGFLGSRDPWLATIDEFRPLFRNSTWAALGLPGLPVAIVALVLFAALRNEERRVKLPELLLLAVPFLFFTLLALIQSRFLPVSAAFGAAAGGAAWSLLEPRRGARRLLWGVSLLTFVPTAVLYTAPFLIGTFRGTAPSVVVWDKAANAIRVKTPDPGNPPKWGVLAQWDFGHPIIFRASRAVALDNFGSMQPGWETAQRLWLEPSPARAVRELDRLRIRYVLVIWPPYFVPSTAASLGLDPNGYFEGGWTPETKPPYRPTPKGERAFSTRLHLRDAAPLPDDTPEDRAALARFRLVWASAEADYGPTEPLPVQKLFELLPEGAPTASR